MRKGFTLIELLVVIAIILILIAIVLPQFMLSVTRAKVSRAQSELRSLSVALGSYQTDYHRYPLCVDLSTGTILPHILRLKPLTTPIPYIETVPADIFRLDVPYSYLEKQGWIESHYFSGEQPPVRGLVIGFFLSGSNWVLSSVGPTAGRPDMADGYDWRDAYSPTNGVLSVGSVLLNGP